MQHSVTAFDDAVLSMLMPDDNIRATPVYVSLELPLWMRELIVEAARTSPDMTISNPDDPEDEPSVVGTQSMPMPTAERMVKSLAIESQRPTAQRAFIKYQRQEREAKRELGRGLTAAGIQVQQHSVKDYTHVIVTLLDLLQGGAIPSISAVVNAAYPNDPKKATSIKNSQHGKRRKQAWNSEAVRNHPMEKAMQTMHCTDSMNRRHSARTFGQSLSINREMFEYYDTVIKLKAQVEEQGTRISTLEQQMACTKNREALADAGATSSRDKVLALDAQGKKRTEIATRLDMPPNTVKSILRRSKSG